MPFTLTKTWRDFPAAHRQHNHNGHCSLIHGHDWRFDICFSADRMDDNGFVIDVGTLQVIKDFLEENFDHTLLLNQDDPQRNHITNNMMFSGCEEDADDDADPLAKVIFLPNCGMEGIAEWVFEEVQALLREHFADDCEQRNLHLIGVQVWEDSKNRCTYKP